MWLRFRLWLARPIHAFYARHHMSDEQLENYELRQAIEAMRRRSERASKEKS